MKGVPRLPQKTQESNFPPGPPRGIVVPVLHHGFGEKSGDDVVLVLGLGAGLQDVLEALRMWTLMLVNSHSEVIHPY